MKILLTGVNGQVGHALQANIHELPRQVALIALSREQLDLTNVTQIRAVVAQHRPDLIINPAAYTAVDKAESEPELAYAINAEAPRILAEEAAKLGAAMIHYSTDYVYDGTKNSPYVESDATNPLGIYAKSKLAGEDAIRAVGLPHLILRTSWVYGVYGKNFMKTILRLAGERDSLRIVADQFGAPTSSQSIANATVELLNKWQPKIAQQSGVYHFTNTGSTSWHGFTCEIIKEYNKLSNKHVLKVAVEQVAAISSAEYPTPAARPANSRLDGSKLKQAFGIELPSWQQALHDVIQHLD